MRSGIIKLLILLTILCFISVIIAKLIPNLSSSTPINNKKIIDYTINHYLMDPVYYGDKVNAIEKAASDWNGKANVEIRRAFFPLAGLVGINDTDRTTALCVEVIIDRGDITTSDTLKYLAACRTHYTDHTKIEIIDRDIIFDVENMFEPQTRKTTHDFQTIAKHEFGHLLGLPDNDDSTSVMYRICNNYYCTNINGISQKDAQMLKSLYPFPIQ